MKIRIRTQYYEKLRKDIRNRAENGEWETWKVIRFSSGKDSDVNIRRLVHVPGNDHQYEYIQLALCTPTKGEFGLGVGFLDFVPKLRENVQMSDDEFFTKSAIVLGRFCEVLNRYFPNLKSYQVILK